MPTAQELDLITSLLKEGKVQDAADLAQKLSKDASAAEAAAAGRIPEPPPPRPQLEVLRDILGAIAHDLGNKPALELLLAEYDEAAK